MKKPYQINLLHFMKNLFNNSLNQIRLIAVSCMLIVFVSACGNRKNENEKKDNNQVKFFKNMQSNVSGYLTQGFNPLSDEVVSKTDCFRFTYDKEGRIIELAFVIKGRVEDSYTFGFAKRVFLYSDSTITFSQYDKFDKKLPMSRANGTSTAFAKQIVLKEGKPFAERGLNFDNEPLTGFTEKRFECDSLGRVIWESNVNNFGRKLDISQRDGIFYRRYDYTANNLMASTSFYEIKTKKRSLGGIHKVVYEYNEAGNIIKNSFLDEQDQMRPEPGTGITYRLMKYNDLGNMIEQGFHGLAGELVLGASGFAQQKNTFDAFSNNTSSSYYDAESKPVENKEIAAFTEKLTYDDRGDLVLNEFFNTESKLINSEILGYAYKALEYNEKGMIAKEAYYDKDNKAIVFKGLGAHAKLSRYDEKGRLIETSFQDQEGVLFLHPACGCARISFVHDSLGNVIEESYLDAAGELTKTAKKDIAQRRYNYNRLGFMELTQYFDANGKEITIQGNQYQP